MLKQITRPEELAGRTIERVAGLMWGTAIVLDNDEFFIVATEHDGGWHYCTRIISRDIKEEIGRGLVNAGIATEEEFAIQWERRKQEMPEFFRVYERYKKKEEGILTEEEYALLCEVEKQKWQAEQRKFELAELARLKNKYEGEMK